MRVGAEFARALCPRLEQIRADDHAGAHLARQPHVHHAHDSETDHEDRFSGTKTRATQGFDYAGGGLDQDPIEVRNIGGKLERIALVGRTDDEKFGHPARGDLGGAPGIALDVFAAAA